MKRKITKKFLDENKLYLVDRICAHIVCQDLLELSEISELISIFPEYRYKGIAYRGIFVDVEKDSEKDICWDYNRLNICWSLDEDTVEIVARSTSEQNVLFAIYQAEVFGFDLSKFCNESSNNQGKFGAMDLSYFTKNEKEVLVYEYNNLILVNKYIK